LFIPRLYHKKVLYNKKEGIKLRRLKFKKKAAPRKGAVIRFLLFI